MKTRKGFFVVGLTAFAIAMSIVAYGADIVVSVTVPDAYVTKLTNMVTDKWMSEPTCALGGAPYVCSDEQYETQEACEENGGSWGGTTPLSLKNCFIKKMIKESIIEDYTTWEREQEPASTKAAFDAARDAYKEALRNAGTAEVEFDVSGE